MVQQNSTRVVSVFPLRYPGVCRNCQKAVQAGELGNAARGVVFCYDCSLRHAIENGYQFRTPDNSPVQSQQQGNGPVTASQPPQGNGMYLSRQAYETDQYGLNDRLAKKFGLMNGELQKLQAENRWLKTRLDQLAEALGHTFDEAAVDTAAQPVPESAPASSDASSGQQESAGFACDYCGKVFDTGQAKGGHARSCNQNPANVNKVKIERNF